MRLAAVMDIVLEEVQQQPVCALGLHASLAMHANNSVRPFLVKRGAKCNQPSIHRSLRRTQLGQRQTRYRIRIRRGSKRAAFECVNIKPIDSQDVVERGLNRRKKPGARRLESATWTAKVVLAKEAKKARNIREF